MKVTRHLVTYEEGQSLLLLNGATVKPVLLRRGKDHIRKLLKSPDDIHDARLVDFLSQHDILVHDDDREEAIFKSCTCNSAGMGLKPGVTLYLLLSQWCNLGCIYCLNGDSSYRASESLLMDERTARLGITRMVSTVMPGGSMEVVLFGGEPLLNWPLAKRVVAFCENEIKTARPDLKIRYCVTSNLTLFPPDLVEWSKRYAVSFLCNIDGKREIHDRTRPFKKGSRSSHDTTARNIEKLRRSGVEVALRATVTSANMHHIVEVSRHHKELGGSSSAFVALNAVNSDREIMDRRLFPDPDVVAAGLKDLVKSGLWRNEQLYPLNRFLSMISPGSRNIWGCGATLGNTPVLDVNGDVYACIYLVGMSAYRLGNIFADEQYPDHRVVDRMMETVNIDSTEQCRDCPIRYICGGACPVGRLSIMGNPGADQETINYTRDIACKINQAMIEASLWHYAEKAELESQQWSVVESGRVACSF